MWNFSKQEIQLRKNEVHIWRASLDRAIEEIENLALLLSPDEHIRANKFRFPLHKNRFIAARAMLRKILGNYLEVEPNQLQFNYGAKGKPSLNQNQFNPHLEFNLSHSENLAIYAITTNVQIGIDLEYIRPISDLAKIAHRFFSWQEYNLITSFPKQEQLKAFFQIWTAKEAYLKATGEGLANSINQVIIDISPEGKTSLVSIKNNNKLAAQWNLYSFITDTNYVASLVVEANKWQLTYYDC